MVCWGFLLSQVVSGTPRVAAQTLQQPAGETACAPRGWASPRLAGATRPAERAWTPRVTVPPAARWAPRGRQPRRTPA